MNADVVFSLPGKLGDNLARLPLVSRYAHSRNVNVDVVIDTHTAPALYPLLTSLPYIGKVTVAHGITSDGCGGQPWDFGAPAWFTARYKEVYHLGYRRFPLGCLTVESLPPNWPDDVSPHNLLNERPLGITWDRQGFLAERPVLHLSAHSSRGHADIATKDTFYNAYRNLGLEKRFDYWYRPDEAEVPLLDVAKQMSTHCVVTTYSAMAQLATIIGAPCVVLIPLGGYGLGHFDSRQRWYPGWRVGDEYDAAGLVHHIDDALRAVGVTKEDMDYDT